MLPEWTATSHRASAIGEPSGGNDPDQSAPIAGRVAAAWARVKARNSVANVPAAAAPKAASATRARHPAFHAGPASARPTPPATNADGCESATATGPAAARPQSQPTRSGRRSHSRAIAVSASAARRSEAYGLTSAECWIGWYATAKIAVASTSGSPARTRPAACRNRTTLATAQARGKARRDHSENPNSPTAARPTHRNSSGQTWP